MQFLLSAEEFNKHRQEEIDVSRGATGQLLKIFIETIGCMVDKGGYCDDCAIGKYAMANNFENSNVARNMCPRIGTWSK